MLRRGSQSTNTVVIGAGPYGLAVAAHLRGAGLDFRVFGKPMGAWRDHMPENMFLKSEYDATCISTPEPGMSLRQYCREKNFTKTGARDPIPIDVFVDYGMQIQQRYVDTLEAHDVTKVSPSDEGFLITLSNGETFSAENVVAASGHMHYAYTPSELRMLSATPAASLVSHASRHAGFSQFAGKSVAVVGAGQSALESAALLSENGAAVHLIVRGQDILWGGPPLEGEHPLRAMLKPKTSFGPGWSHFAFINGPVLISRLPSAARLFLAFRSYGPAGAWWLRDRVEGKVKISLATVVEKLREDKGRAELQLRDSTGSASTVKVDHVIAATGYKVDVDLIDYLDPSIGQRVARVPGAGAPHLSRSFESTVPGLYFVGLAAASTFGPLLRFVHGTDFAARSVCAAIASAANIPARNPGVASAVAPV